LFARHKRYICAPLAAMALWAVVLVASPAVAQAQAAKHPANPKGAERPVVVSPGDSLWSISSERLGGAATPQQIAEGVELIYARNQNRIGPDPNQIFAGQRLSVPQAMDGGAGSIPTDAKASTSPPSATREGAGREAAAVSPTKRGQEGNAGHKTEQIAPAAATGNETPNLPRVSEEAAPAVPSVRQTASEASAQLPVLETLTEVRTTAAAENPRRTLAWVILVLTAVAGTLMAWKLPLKRTTGRDAERWAQYGYYGYYGREHHTTYSGNLAMPTVERDERGQRAPHENPAPPAPAALEGSSTNGAGSKRSKVGRHPLAGGTPRMGLAKRRRLGRAAARSSGRSVVRNGLVPGVTRAEVHHALRVRPNGGIQAVRRQVGRRR
jgi:hypothetical protein